MAFVVLGVPFNHYYFYTTFQATGDVMDDDGASNGVGWDYANEKFDMKVPERILVVGQDQHMGEYKNIIVLE